MKNTILLTRPHNSSETSAKHLARRGLACIIEPVLTITPTFSPSPIGDFQAIFITSAHAAETLIDNPIAQGDWLCLPCFCVGRATANAARLAGFQTIIEGDDNSAALARLALGRLSDTAKPVLHIAGDHADPKMVEILAAQGFNLISWIVYHAQARDTFTAATIQAFTQGRIAAAPVFSPRSAQILVALIEKNHLVQTCNRIIAIGLSQAVADVLQTLPWREVRIAAAPTEDAMFATMEELLNDRK